MGRTGLILRQWVERNGCKVTAYQAYAYDTGSVITSRTEALRVFIFRNEWRAKLCETRMSTNDWKLKNRYWMRYFNNHIDPPNIFTSSPINTFGVPFLYSPSMVLPVLAILIILCTYLI